MVHRPFASGSGQTLPPKDDSRLAATDLSDVRPTDVQEPIAIRNEQRHTEEFKNGNSPGNFLPDGLDERLIPVMIKFLVGATRAGNHVQLPLAWTDPAIRTFAKYETSTHRIQGVGIMIRHLTNLAGGWIALVICVMFFPAQVKAQGLLGGGLGAFGNDPFTSYYAFYLPNQQIQALRPTPMDSINQALVSRQYYAQSDRRSRLYNPISPYSTDQNYDPLRPYGPQGTERVARPFRFVQDPSNSDGSGPSLYYNRATQYFPGLRSGRGPNGNVYTPRRGAARRREPDGWHGWWHGWDGWHGRNGWHGWRHGWRHGNGRNDVVARSRAHAATGESKLAWVKKPIIPRATPVGDLHEVERGLSVRFDADFRAWFKIMIPQVTKTGWLGSSWQLPASPQSGGPRSRGVALRASTPATPGGNLILNHEDFRRSRASLPGSGDRSRSGFPCGTVAAPCGRQWTDGRPWKPAALPVRRYLGTGIPNVARRPEQLRLTPDERADLVAYVDGELPETHARSIATKLTHSATARREVEMLQKTWELLDYLPRPEVTGAVLGKNDLADSATRAQDARRGSRRSRSRGSARLGRLDGVLRDRRGVSRGSVTP